MGIKLSLPQVNSFIKLYSSKWEYNLSENEISQVMETLLGAEKFFFDKKEEELFHEMIGLCRGKREHKEVADVLKKTLPYFSILLLRDIDPFEKRDNDLLESYFGANKYFPGMITIIREQYISERIENVHLWVCEIFNSITSWPALFICNPDNFSMIDLSFDPIGNQLFDIGKNLEKDMHTAYSAFSSIGLLKKQEKNVDVIYHISDLHLGANRSESRFDQLLRRLKDDKKSHQGFEPKTNFSVVCTGDITNNSRKYEILLANKVKQQLKHDISDEVVFLPGNHDSKKIQGNLLSATSYARKKLFDEGVNLKFNNRVILLGLDSNIDTTLAQGNISEEDYQAYEAEFSTKKSQLNSRGISIGALHHHPVNVKVNHPFQNEWYETWFGPIQNWAINMHDVKKLQAFLSKCGIQVVLFGHKHQPHFSEENGMKFIGCGSSLGYRGFKDEDLVLCYNKITINHYSRLVSVDYVMFRPDSTRVLGASRAISRDDHILTFKF